MTRGDHQRLIVFTRYPEPGRVKTRLIPALGEAGAANLHHWMTIRTLVQVRRSLPQEGPSLSLEVRFEGGDAQRMSRWLGRDLSYRPQGPGDLGERLARAFDQAFAEDMEEVVVIGSDCPGLRAARIAEAFRALQGKELVLGPARDGGYYLIGLRRAPPSSAIPRLFSGIPWGTGEVLQRTLETAQGLCLPIQLLETLADIDRPEDLSLWADAATGITPPGGISVIIPARNEAEGIGGVIASAQGGSDVEILVVDGQSEDGTAEIARSKGAQVLVSRPGRAHQMNLGAERANGDLLLFLHADTRLPPGFDDMIRDALAHPERGGGAFSLRIDAPSPGLRRIERLANWRSRRLNLPYGDQGIFLRADIFWELGGFPELPIMEDFELARRMGRRGRTVILPQAVLTSPRRWLALGLWRTTLINQGIILGYLLGISPSFLARLYRRAKGRSRKARG